ncbi:MAG: ribonuclease HI [Proteobacteria bacterium]|nr:ribonuclease HI [Pseudomonadota bacterium]RZO98755.1 MAG: ribonuclease HI [Gammaproteobacteria bacterium]|tara:strand:- start:497 stop:934 length:438 start_codon:yes stop_codon:yes gene_type:complete
MKKINIYTDGACKGNPGPGGWGALIVLEDEQIELSGGKKETTNNQMELMAVIKSLEHFDNKIDAIIYTDSKYVMDGITNYIKRWKINGWKTASKKPVKNSELWKSLDSLNSFHNIQWNWVKGHSGHPGNEKADALANLGIDKISS